MKNQIFVITFFLTIVAFCFFSAIAIDDRNQVIDDEKEMMKDMILVQPSTFKFHQDKSISVGGFYILSHEVTNKEYRKFIQAYLKDSLVTLGKETIMKKYYPNSKLWEKELANQPENIRKEWSNYFENPKFDEYPVVGISWKAAQEYCRWRTIYHNNIRRAKGLFDEPSFRLPAEVEFECAAMAGDEKNIYPWKSDSLNENLILKKKYAVNGEGISDNFQFTSPVKSFSANAFRIYDLAGNVSEMCSSAYPEYNSGTIAMRVYNINDSEPLKVIKGGSWKDKTDFLQFRNRRSFHEDSVSVTVGFRIVKTFIEKSKREF